MLGESGTGKSHLIQWLRLHIPNEPNTVKLTIPKTGTSLRGIVKRLIQELPSAEQDEFSARLRESGAQLTTQNAKIDLFLNALSWSIEHGGRSTDEVDDGLKQLLPSVFIDPHFRAGFFRTPGGTVDQIVKHIFDPPDERGQETARQFNEKDLPLDGRFYHQAAGPSKDAIDFINAEDGIRTRAVALMNASLEGAISQTLNFSADNLIDLMNALRRHLERQGKRLILLIEDFARLQGIDTALLQALITPPGQGSDRLCELRWAMAVTTGYFRRLDSTVRTRANIVVDMDTSMPASLEAMTAKYLNAVRVGEKRLLEESATGHVPIECSTCDIRQSCFSAFGEVEGIGLFPFTRQAISIFADRTGATVDHRFNPRRYLRAVVEPVLFTCFSEIERGEFPSSSLLDSLGGSKALTPANRAVITSRDGEERGERRIALLELWDGSGKLVNLPEGIQSAFGLPALKDAGSAPIQPPPSEDKKSVPAKPESAVPFVAELQAWDSEKRVLPQAAITPCGALVCASLESYIDWDALGFRKSEISSANGSGSVPFRRLSVNFRDQQVQPSTSLVMLTLPLDPRSAKDRRDTALALQALLLFERNKTWEFDDANIMLPILLEMLDRWAEFVKQEILLLYAPTKNWNPAVAASELLALGIRQSGRHGINAKVESLILKMWEANEPPAMAYLTPQFAQANKKILGNWTKLQGIVRLLCSGTKGGQSGNFVNPVPVTRAVRTLSQRSLKLTQEPPQESKIADLQTLADIYREAKPRYLLDLEAERSAWVLWGEKLSDDLGAEGTFTELVKGVRDSIAEFESAGLVGGTALTKLKSTLDAFRIVDADRAKEHVTQAKVANPIDAIVRVALASTSREPIEELFSRTDDFLSSAEVSVRNRLVEEAQKAGPGLAQSKEAIAIALEQLSEASGAFLPSTGEKA